MAVISAFVVAMICAWFAVLVAQRYMHHRKLSHWFWTWSLTASAVASFAYCATVWTTPHSPMWFKLYYLLGAMWMPSIMGLGSLALVFSRRIVIGIAIAVAVIGVIGSFFLLGANDSAEALNRLNGEAGTGILKEGVWLPFLIVLNSFGAVAVIGVAGWSAWRFVRRKERGRFFYGNLALAGGVFIISSAGSGARLGWPRLFWGLMLVGWIITFAGYTLLTPRLERRAATTQFV